MTSPLENLAKLDASIHTEPTDAAEYEGFLNVDERLVSDLITATTRVIDALDARGPL